MVQKTVFVVKLLRVIWPKKEHYFQQRAQQSCRHSHVFVCWKFRSWRTFKISNKWCHKMVTFIGHLPKRCHELFDGTQPLLMSVGTCLPVTGKPSTMRPWIETL